MYELKPEAADGRLTEEDLMKFLRSVLLHEPGLFVSTQDDAGCFMRALRKDEPTFTVRAQDETSVATVAYWHTVNPQLSPERALQVMNRITAIRAWPTKKKAD